MGVTADHRVVGRHGGQNIGGAAVGSDAGKAALRGAQRSRSGSDHAEPEEDIAAAVGRDRRVDENGGIEGGGIAFVVGQTRVEDPPDGSTGSIGVGAVDREDRPARAGIVQTGAGRPAGKNRLV